MATHSLQRRRSSSPAGLDFSKLQMGLFDMFSDEDPAANSQSLLSHTLESSDSLVLRTAALIDDSSSTPVDLVESSELPSSDAPASPRRRSTERVDATHVPPNVARKFLESSVVPYFSFQRPKAGTSPSYRRVVYDLAPDGITIESKNDLDKKIFEGMSDEQLLAEHVDWLPTDCEVRWLHQKCLTENLAFLQSEDRKPRVATEKGRILQWLFTVDELNGVNVREIPFSFHNCCLACGVSPDELLSKLLQKPLVRQLLVKFGFYTQDQLPELRKVVIYARSGSQSDKDVAENVTFLKDSDSPDLPDGDVYQFGWG